MKIVRIYYKPPPEADGRDGKLYRRKVQGSQLISLVFCLDKEQENLIKQASNLMPLLNEDGGRVSRQYSRMRNGL